MAQATGVAADSVRRGRKEAQDGTAPGRARSRRAGGGRKRAESHNDGLIAAFESLIDPLTGGDPESPLRWTSKSIRALTAALREKGHEVSDFVTRRLLREGGYSLQVNAKTIEGTQHADRDAQFCYLNDQAEHHLGAGDPVISVDTKKTELVGSYKNGGREWRPIGDPDRVRVADFADKTLGKANPYGVYDIGANTGWVSVGTDHDTAEFAVNTIATWWREVGKPMYPTAGRLMISAGGGGSNEYSTRPWKTELARFAAATGFVGNVRRTSETRLLARGQ